MNIASHWEKSDPNLKLTSSFLDLFCLFLLPIWEPPALTGPPGDFWCPSKLVHWLISPSISKGSALPPRPCLLLWLLFQGGLCMFWGLYHPSLCCFNLLIRLPISSLTFIGPICSPLYRQNVILKCESNHVTLLLNICQWLLPKKEFLDWASQKRQLPPDCSHNFGYLKRGPADFIRFPKAPLRNGCKP